MDDANSSRFWDRIAERYAQQPVPDQAVYERKLEITREYLKSDMNVLEFGCGTGSTAMALAACVSRFHAIDSSARMIEIARGKAALESLENVRFEQAAIENYDAPVSSLDAVIGHSILHLVRDRRQVLDKVHRALKPDGVFISTTACIGDFMPWFKWVIPAGRFLGLMPNANVFTEQQLLDEMMATGFSLEFSWRPVRTRGVFLIVRKL